MTKANCPDSYLIALGKLSLAVNLYWEESDKLARCGILTDEELEIAETIKHRTNQLLLSISDQVRTVSQRCPEDWLKTYNQLKDKVNG